VKQKLADSAADALEQLIRRPPGGRNILSAVLIEALDRHELARLHAVAIHHTGQRPEPDWFRYCPFCSFELEDPSQSALGKHLEIDHRRMLES
jgi:hypothetical protein